VHFANFVFAPALIGCTTGKKNLLVETNTPKCSLLCTEEARYTLWWADANSGLRIFSNCLTLKTCFLLKMATILEKTTTT